ncbi:zinc finger protein 239-like [Sabethes cyaneus]|uniref:zinc finger protein 239-like n=1 Tax=Sabethes cyaneus TaxID=53552 RepID=UPI00237E83A0|nr:zinc finger protein 239-like [Sabethes cyaneus]
MEPPVLYSPLEETVDGNEKQVLEQIRFYVENYERLCRLCLTNEKLVNLYSIVQERNVFYVRHFIKEALRMMEQTIDKKDCLPNFICEKCERNLNIIFNFKKKCDKSRRILEKVRDKTIAVNDLFDPEVHQTGDKLHISRSRAKRVHKADCSELLKKLPQDINIEKVRDPTKTIKLTCAVEQSLVNSTLKPKLETDDIKHEVASLGLLFPETDINIELHDLTNLGHESGPLENVHDPVSEKDCIDDHVSDGISESNDQHDIFEEIDTSHNNHDFPTRKKRKSITVRQGIQGRPVGSKTRSQGKKLPKEKTICPVCGALVNNIKCHMVTHDEVRPHQCEQCPKGFTSRNKLQSHVNSVHLKKRDFKCEVCGKAFLEKNNLKGHQRIHNGERKYKCDLCPKTFLFAGTLRCHKLTHTQDKKHECQVCGKLFLMRTTLNKHLYVHSNERPHKCDMCDKTFRTSTHKIIHMRTHTGEKPLQCRICGAGFAHHKARSVHMKTKHAEELVAMDMLDERGHLKF